LLKLFFYIFLAKRIDSTYNIITTELNRLPAVEGTMVLHAAQHSYSYTSQACTINMSRKCFPDSSTAKNITCGKTKARIIPRSIRRGRKRPFLIVFDSFGSNRITAVFHRIVNELKWSDTPFSGRLRQLLTVYIRQKTVVIRLVPNGQYTACKLR
jgi:hypothetical protein